MGAVLFTAGAVLFSALFYLFMLLTSVLCFPVAVLVRTATGPFDRRLTLLHRFTSWWGSLYTRCNPLWHVELPGQPVPPGTFVMVANHQSMIDILLLFRLRAHYKWVSKVENFRVPFVGWNMTLNRYIAIRRGTVQGNLRMMRECEAALREGNSLMIFPEGTRSPDGAVRRFKEGAFELAHRTGTPVLPLVIDGTSEALPKHGVILRGRRTFRLRMLDPVPPRAEGAPAALAREVEAAIRRELHRLRSGRLPGS
jgi:1-acyl-sn-glycerol-3-phosphate acyltransferase